jgi:hypothetical protein
MLRSELNNLREVRVCGRVVRHNQACEPRIWDCGKRDLQVSWSRWEDGDFEAECLRHFPEAFDHPDDLGTIKIP